MFFFPVSSWFWYKRRIIPCRPHGRRRVWMRWWRHLPYIPHFTAATSFHPLRFSVFGKLPVFISTLSWRQRSNMSYSSNVANLHADLYIHWDCFVKRDFLIQFYSLFFFLLKFHQELVNVYTHLKDMCASLRHRGVNMQDCSDFTMCEDIRPGVLSNLLEEFKELMQDVLTFKPTVRYFKFW